ncbi:hypothetical protein EV44_g1313 [Erysiphe necator]|uniref:Uncharacterized protein n=1 Tax=Uncinula necator TaxID=52586 RepID=A0A0B1PD59_UNCNE|nr:hypothetical protein EV44_g1313 [Erysiphe necator]
MEHACPQSEVKVLGILVDSRLQWEAQKGHAAFNALSRITSSVWGPSLRNSRLRYTAVVRPTMLYGSQILGMWNDGQPMVKSLISKLDKVQNNCLRKITGDYKPTSKVVLEREAKILPVELKSVPQPCATQQIQKINPLQ